MTRRILGSVLVALLLLASSAQAGKPRTHDGLLLRMSGGFGFDNTQLDNVELNDTGGDFNFALGGMVKPNLAVHGTLWGWDVSDPDVTVNDNRGTPWHHMSLAAAGGGVTYYLMPANIYLSGSLGMGKLSFEDQDGNTGDTDLGVALDMCIGKEWWVGNSWGLGVAGDLNYHSFPDGVVDGSWDGVSFGIRFSATLN
jgi:hypothetical protein